MGLLTIVLLSVALSMDSLAVALCIGAAYSKITRLDTFKIAVTFCIMHILMPTAGFYCGLYFEQIIKSYDHWVAFFLLLFVGGKMIYESFDKSCCEIKNPARFSNLALMAVATSIDALAVGITFSLSKTPLVPAIFIMGATVGIITYSSVFAGKKVGTVLKSKAEVAGGIVLILIGIKILISG